MNDQSIAKSLSAPADAPKLSDTTLAAFIWKNAEDLWGDFKHTDFGKIILPFTLLRRLECVLEPSRDAVRGAHAKFKDNIHGSVQAAVVRALTSHIDLAAHVMKHDQQTMVPLIALVYEMIKSGGNIDLSTVTVGP